MGTLAIFIFLLSIVVISADSETQPEKKRFDLDFMNKRSNPISDAPDAHEPDDEEFEYGVFEEDDQPAQKRFDPFVKRFDIYKRFDPHHNKRFDPFMKRFDPFAKRFDPLYKRFDPFYKRFDPMLKKRFDREETVRHLLYSLGQSKRNVIDPRAFNIGFGR